MISELTIVIPALNEARYLPRLLSSITHQTYSGKLQVVVVDGRSTDRTIEVTREFMDRISDLTVLEAKPDIGHQRNLGATHARYQHLLFLDADVELPPKLLVELFAKVPTEGPFIACTTHTSHHIDLVDRLFLAIAYVLMLASRLAGVPAVNGDFILTTRSQHNKIGGFVEGAILGEDIDYCLRSTRAGAKYHYFFKPMVLASDRRVRDMGRAKLLKLWLRGYMRVLKQGPIFPGQGFDYPFGHYDGPQAPDASEHIKKSSQKGSKII